jgi:hypothetical protein
MPRALILLLPACLALALGGCAFPGVAWRPDSSGFVYADKGGRRLVSFDMKTKKTRELVADTGTNTAWPAVSPDGKRVAVARCEARKGLRHRLRVILYGMDGKEERRSPWFELKGTANGKEDKVVAAHLHWATADQILVVVGQTCIYDVARDSLRQIEGCTPWIGGAAAVRPDGKGFLAYQETPNNPQLVFVDWQGQKQHLDGKLPRTDGDSFLSLREWEKGTAILDGPAGTYEADTARRTLRRAKGKPVALLPAEGQRLAFHLFPGAATAVCLYLVEKREADGPRRFERIEVHDLLGLNRRVIVAECRAWPLFFPSPDRKHLALFYEVKGQPPVPHILVLDSAGKVAADFTIEA